MRMSFPLGRPGAHNTILKRRKRPATDRSRCADIVGATNGFPFFVLNLKDIRFSTSHARSPLSLLLISFQLQSCKTSEGQHRCDGVCNACVKFLRAFPHLLPLHKTESQKSFNVGVYLSSYLRVLCFWDCYSLPEYQQSNGIRKYCLFIVHLG